MIVFSPFMKEQPPTTHRSVAPQDRRKSPRPANQCPGRLSNEILA
jgi:hypothetical protein